MLNITNHWGNGKQNKIIMRYHLTLVRIAMIKKTRNNNVSEVVEKKQQSYTVGGNVIDATTVEKSIEVSNLYSSLS